MVFDGSGRSGSDHACKHWCFTLFFSSDEREQEIVGSDERELQVNSSVDSNEGETSGGVASCESNDSGEEADQLLLREHWRVTADRLERRFSEFGCESYVFQLERSPTTSRYHLQGYLSLGKKLRFKQVKALFDHGVPHLEKAKGTPASNLAYCTKEESRVAWFEPRTFGEFPGKREGRRTDLEQVAKRAREGRIRDICDEFPSEFIKFHKGILALVAHTTESRRFKTRVQWLCGRTGSGKSYYAWHSFPDAYAKPPTHKWWDGYDRQCSVVVDDYRRDFCTFAELLRLCDQYPHVVEYKGGTCQFLARDLIITSPLDPYVTWVGRESEELLQLCRRIESVKYFEDDFVFSEEGVMPKFREKTGLEVYRFHQM